jgi:hypothetical protein
MPAVKRRVFNMLAAVSLVLCAAVITLWLRSYRVSDDFWWWGERYGVGLFSSEGRIELWQGTWTPTAQGGSPEMVHLAVSPPVGFLRQPTRGLYWPRYIIGLGSATKDGVHWRQLYLPHGLWAIAAAAIPARWWLSRRRMPSGHCAACGYDLRATPDRCPECGTAVGPAA